MTTDTIRQSTSTPLSNSGSQSVSSQSATGAPVSSSATPESAARKWKPLGSVLRRVVGVLVEKSKTTPDQYPLTMNALITGCNQKSNRDPQMTLTEDQVEQALTDLRELGAVTEVQGGGRVPRFRHLMYDWLAVEKAELGVMAELLLRGAQTIGELRGHAARMEAIPDLNTLRPILQSLLAKGLVIELTSEGRGQVVCHALLRDKELAELRARYQSVAGDADPPSSNAPRSSHDLDEPSSSTESARSSAGTQVPRGVSSDMFAEIRLEVAELRAEVSRLRQLIQGQQRDATSE